MSMNKSKLQGARPLILVFVLATAFFIIGADWLKGRNISQDVLIVGNLLLFAVSLVSFLITTNSFQSPNPQAFVRAMYLSFLLKFFLLAIGAFIYIMVTRKEVNKPALIACAGLYIIYTGIETRSLMKLLKQKRNA